MNGLTVTICSVRSLNKVHFSFIFLSAHALHTLKAPADWIREAMIIILIRTSMLDRGVMEITIMLIITGMEDGNGNEHEEILCKYSSNF